MMIGVPLGIILAFSPCILAIIVIRLSCFLLLRMIYFLAVKGYFTLKHSNIDKTGALAVGGMNGTEFERRYADVITKEPKRVSNMLVKHKSSNPTYLRNVPLLIDTDQ